MTSPYELLDELRSAPKPLPSRDDMCWSLAVHAADTASLLDLKVVYREDHRRYLYEYVDQSEIEQQYNELPEIYKVQP
jgi:hypothetical protein